MKRIFMAGLVALAMSPAFAEVEFKSLEITDNSTVIELEDAQAGDAVMVTSAKLINGDKVVAAKMMMCGLTDGVASFKLTFPYQEEFDNAQVVLVINDEEVTCEIPDDLEFEEVDE